MPAEGESDLFGWEPGRHLPLKQEVPPRERGIPCPSGTGWMSNSHTLNGENSACDAVARG